VPSKAPGTTTVRRWRTAAVAAWLLGSPLTGTETRARSPARLVWTVLGPKARSAARSASSLAMAAATTGERTSPSTTIWAGDVRPPEKSRDSTVNACLDWMVSG
jgi:hypothetical protein